MLVHSHGGFQAPTGLVHSHGGLQVPTVHSLFIHTGAYRYLQGSFIHNGLKRYLLGLVHSHWGLQVQYEYLQGFFNHTGVAETVHCVQSRAVLGWSRSRLLSVVSGSSSYYVTK